MTYAMTYYWVEGTADAIHRLYEAMAAADGRARKTIENLGLDPKEYDTERVEWCNPQVENKEGFSVLHFEEAYPYERGETLDALMESDLFSGKLMRFYYYAEEGANADLYETNDAEGKYWPYRFALRVDTPDGEDSDFFYCKDEREIIDLMHTKYAVPEELNDLDEITQFVNDRSSDGDAMWVMPVDVVDVPSSNPLKWHEIRGMMDSGQIEVTAVKNEKEEQ